MPIKTNQQYIREAYRDFSQKILEEYPRRVNLAPVWHLIHFTPIERNVWQDILYMGLPMVPQYPVLGFFLDFADPVKKVGIEVDGAAWHTDVEADIVREDKIMAQGWRLWRVWGSGTYYKRPEDNEIYPTNPASVDMVREIHARYYGGRDD